MEILAFALPLLSVVIAILVHFSAAQAAQTEKRKGG